MKTRHLLFLPLITLLAFLMLSCNQSGQKTVSKGHRLSFNICNYGAVGDGKTLCTDAINSAIEAAHEAGGGTVIIPAGQYLSGSVILKSHVTLRIAQGATLLGSTQISDYQEMTWGHNKDRQPYHLINAHDQKDIRIEGMGTIDGQGKAFWKDYKTDEDGDPFGWILPKEKKVSPLIEIVRCENVQVEDVTIKTGGGWNLHLHDCHQAKVDGVNVLNNLYSPNSDGIDITGGQDVTVSNCIIKTCDDGVVLKTTPDSKPLNGVTVTNCSIVTNCAALKLGATESYKPIKNVVFSNCTVDRSSRAFGLYMREGGTFENINVSNITANTRAPLVLNRPIHIMAHKKHDTSGAGTIRNVTISNFTCTTEGRILITSAEGCTVENIVLRDINLKYPYIEDPVPYAKGSTSGQFPGPEENPGAIDAPGAVVVAGINDFVLDNLMLKYPGKTVPKAWQHEQRFENGGFRFFKPDYSQPRQTELHALWLRNVRGGYLRIPLARPSDTASRKTVYQQNTQIKQLQ